MRRATIVDVFRFALGSSRSEWKPENILGPREIESIRAHYLNWSQGTRRRLSAETMSFGH